MTLYSRAYCHLCHEMREQLEALRGELDFQLEVLDVDADAALEERYGELVPVLEHEGAELARHRLDAAAVRAYLAGLALKSKVDSR
jgi:hypothetical protein